MDSSLITAPMGCTGPAQRDQYADDEERQARDAVAVEMLDAALIA